jgi:hypothetical protein
MTIRTKLSIMAATLVAASGTAYATPVDLSTWIDYSPGGGNWTVQGVLNDSVLQSVNGNPTFFYEAGTNAQGLALSGTIKVETTGDDDFIGFALGFDSDDINSTSADYILIDWKQLNQSPAKIGLAISHVSDSTDDSNGFNDYWDHTGGVTEIQRGATLGNVGWGDNVEHSFDLQFTSSLITVSVDGNLELSITPADVTGISSFDDGSFAFYNFSQNPVRYGAIQQQQSSLVPDGGATAMLLALGLLPLAIKRRLQAAKKSTPFLPISDPFNGALKRLTQKANS